MSSPPRARMRCGQEDVGHSRPVRSDTQVRSNFESSARLAQLAERTALNRMVVGSSPTVGRFFFLI